MIKEKYNLSLDQLAAIYTTYKDLDPYTRRVYCCTCGRSIKVTSIEDSYKLFGHFIPRSINRNLIYYPYNIHVQCYNCNMNSNNIIHDKYKNYMIYRYGEDIFSILNTVVSRSDEFYRKYYIYKLYYIISKNFKEIYDMFFNNSRFQMNIRKFEDNLSYQFFNSYSATYEQDLDNICKLIGSKEFIEYERF